MAFAVTRVIEQVENEIFTSSGERKNKIHEDTEFFYKNLINAQACGILAYTYPGYQIVAVNAEALRMFGCENIDLFQTELANTGSSRYYIQSAYSLPDEAKRTQEIRPFRKIDDSFRKIVITKDIVKPYYDDYGILTVNIYDFLLEPQILEK